MEMKYLNLKKMVKKDVLSDYGKRGRYTQEYHV